MMFSWKHNPGVRMNNVDKVRMDAVCYAIQTTSISFSLKTVVGLISFQVQPGKARF